MLYFAVSSGFTVHTHYCMGRLVSTSITQEAGDDHQCTHCGMKKKKGGNGCCNDEHKIVKSVADGALVKEFRVAPVSCFILPVIPVYTVAECPVRPSAAVQPFSAHPPPGPPSCPVYLEVRNLRI